MILHRSSAFERQFRKLPPALQHRVNASIRLFMHHPFDVRLRNHALKGELKGFRSIAAGHDLRLIYQEKDGHAFVILITVGTHDEVY
jgi:addiction module RelE/StbE family toxin